MQIFGTCKQVHQIILLYTLIDRRPFTPDIFNSLSPYYNRYLVNSTIQDLQQVINISNT